MGNLPKRGKYIDWVNSVGCKCKFIYDDIEGEVEIVDYEVNRVSFKYDNEIYNMINYKFTKCQFGKILGKYTDKFKVEIDTIFKDDKT